MARSMIAASRRIDWSVGVGVEGGIPTYPVEIDASESPYNADPTGASDSRTAIQNALDACSSGMAVYLPTGTYKVLGNLVFPSNVVLRGDGPLPWYWVWGTVLLVQHGSDAIEFSDSEGSTSTTISGSPTKGTATLTVASATSFAVGDCCWIDQLNGSDVATGEGGTAEWCGLGDDPNRVQGQAVKISGKSGNDLTFDRPLSFDLSSGLSPRLVKVWDPGCVKSGIEGIEIQTSSAQDGADQLNFVGAVECWAYNCKITPAGSHCIRLEKAFRCTVHACWIEDGWSHPGDHSYGVWIRQATGDCLIENNIFHKLRHSVACEGASSGCVIAYNYSDFNIDENEASCTWLVGDLIHHGYHSHNHLWEGNRCTIWMPDNQFGSSTNHTCFRNRCVGISPGQNTDPLTQHLLAAEIQSGSHRANVVGCVLGDSTVTYTGFELSSAAGSGNENNPFIYKLGFWDNANFTYGADSGDETVSQIDIFRHGNYDEVNQSIQWDSGEADHDLPDSYYLDSQPAWWPAAKPWPCCGPDLSPMYTAIPAEDRFNNVPVQSATTHRRKVLYTSG